MKRRRIAALALAVASICGPIAALETLDWRQAAECVGRICGIGGTVALEEEADGVTRLYFDPERRDVSVLLVTSLFVSWPPYAGQRIVATGKVRRFRDQIEIVVSRPRDILMAPVTSGPPTETPPPVAAPAAPSATQVPAAVATPTAPSGDTEVERLRRQVEQLEQRVRELEGTH